MTHIKFSLNYYALHKFSRALVTWQAVSSSLEIQQWTKQSPVLVELIFYKREMNIKQINGHLVISCLDRFKASRGDKKYICQSRDEGLPLDIE